MAQTSSAAQAMSAPSPVNNPPGSASNNAPVDPFIDGYFGIIDITEDFCEAFIGDLDRELGIIVDDSTRKFQFAAEEDSDWASFSTILQVELMHGEISFTHLGSDADDSLMTLIEYGTADYSPNPLFRMFGQEATDDINSRAKEAVIDLVPYE